MRRRALRKRYGRALPLVLIPLAKAGGVAFAKLKSLGSRGARVGAGGAVG